MNIHKKILSLGFKRVGYHEREYRTDGSYLYQMSPKPGVTEKKYNYATRKYDITFRKAPKWTYFYLLKYSDNIKIWAKIEKHNDITIYLESPKSKTGVDVIYDMPNYGNKNTTLQSEKDIIDLLPSEIQRDLIIDSLFK